jgi:ADP-ribosyl-[dinitrogen reductase] hydrolase
VLEVIVMLNKIKGALYGFAIGDALGVTTEFLTKEEIQTKYGYVHEIVGGGVFNFPKGGVSDDTDMTLAVAKGILKKPQDPIEEIGEEFLDWYHADPRPLDVGITICTVMEVYDGDWNEAAKVAYDYYLNKKAGGNGSLMRCLPIALAYEDKEVMEDITRKQSKMTHYEPVADDACVIYNRIAYHILRGKDLKEAIKDEIRGTIYESALTGEKPSCVQSGYVVDTMHWVLYWLLNSETYLDVIIGATNEGYDTDTVAAIAGGLAGLACGFDELPKEYCEVLLVKDELDQLSTSLAMQLKETTA